MLTLIEIYRTFYLGCYQSMMGNIMLISFIHEYPRKNLFALQLHSTSKQFNIKTISLRNLQLQVPAGLEVYFLPEKGYLKKE